MSGGPEPDVPGGSDGRAARSGASRADLEHEETGAGRRRRRGGGPARVLLVAAVAGALVWGAGRVAADSGLDLSRRDAGVTSVSSEPSATRLICPGSLVPGATAQVRTVARSNAAGEGVALRPAPPEPSVPTATGSPSRGGSVHTLRGEQAAVLQVPDAGAVTATQTQVGTGSGGQGLGTTACAAPQASAYLVAGGREPGRVTRLALINPGANAVPVRVSVLGGPAPQEVSLPGGGRTSVVVPTGAQAAPVIRVDARSGTVAAFVSDVQFAGAGPQGVEVSGPAVAPARESVVPAVRRRDGGGASVRVAVPGRQEAVVRLRVLATGDGAPDDVVATIPAGAAQNIPLTLPDGDYAVAVSADEPVVAAGESWTWTGSGAGDRMWSPAVVAGSGPVQVALPSGVPGGGDALLLSAPGDKAARVRVTTIGAGGGTSDETVSVPAGGARALQVRGARGYRVQPLGKDAVAAGLVSWGTDGGRALLSSISLEPGRHPGLSTGVSD